MPTGKYQTKTEAANAIIPAVDSTVYNGKVRVLYDVLTTTSDTSQTHNIGALPIGARFLYAVAAYGGMFSATNAGNKISLGYTGSTTAFGEIANLGTVAGTGIFVQSIADATALGKVDVRRTTELPLVVTIARGGTETITAGKYVVMMVFYAVE